MKYSIWTSLLFVVSLLASLSADEQAVFTTEQIDFFESQVRPTLSTHCLKCHGPKKQEAGLRLDSREAVLKGGDAGPIVKLDAVERSKLVRAVRYDGDLQMPPDRRLKSAQVASIVKWLEAGLPWPKETTSAPQTDIAKRGEDHWAFQPIVRPPLPNVKDASWPRTAVDRFVLAKLEANKLHPAPQASPRTLIRRATFDLTGLPPTPEKIAAFEQASEGNAHSAYRDLIDRLLASPRYGERWGRHWLDVARYADNKGYVFFEEKKFPWAYTYRDWVVEALNRDLPYDQFILQQIAADQLDLGEDRQALRAMGFLTLGARFMNNIHDVMDDRIDVVTRGLMGITVTCARCHDHKFDPIPQADYYSLYGVMRSSSEPTLPPEFEPPPNTDAYKKFSAEMDKRSKKLVDFVVQKHNELVTDARTRIKEYLLEAYKQRNQPPTDDFMLLTDKGAVNPTMILRWRVYLEKAREADDPIWRPWHTLASLDEADVAVKADDVLKKLLAEDEENQSSERIHPLVRKALLSRKSSSLEDVAATYGQVLIDINKKWQATLKEAADKEQPTPSKLANSDEESLRLVLYGEEAPAEVPVIFGWGFLALFPDRPTQGEYKKLLKDVETWSVSAGSPPRAMTLQDSETLFQANIFLRGNPHRLGQPVKRHFLVALDKKQQTFQRGSGRLELAQAIVDPANPLTGRVIVNRVWMHHFGQPLVKTPSDFGLRSEPPSHPKLLDYLAAELIESGWSLKSLHRLIMNSAVYQQHSTANPPADNVDPGNRLLWKMNRRRLSFEALRDTMLSTSGELNQELGGPSANLYGGNLITRRTIYGFVDRMNLPPLLNTFDFPSPAASSSGRNATTVPPQSLYLMNGKHVGELAKRLVRRSDVAQLKTPERIKRIYVLLFGREPAKAELDLAESFLKDKAAEGRWARYIHGLMMTNEFVFID